MQIEIQWLTIGNLCYKGLLYINYLDAGDFIPFFTLFCPHDLVRMVIKYPGIDS